MMQEVFSIVYRTLIDLSAATGLSYNEINILVYYLIIPMMFFAMIDKIIGKHFFKIGLVVVWILILIVTDFNEFSDGLFAASVKFLLMFESIGWNYTVSSVIICVLIPGVIFAALFYYSYWPSLKKLVLEKVLRKTKTA